jgi:hypothetical protein
VRMMPVVVVLSVLLACTVCLVAWVMAGRPTRTRARHGIEPGRPAEEPSVDLTRTLDGSGFDDLPFDAVPGVIGPEDDPDFIRQLARVVAEQAERFHPEGELPPE